MAERRGKLSILLVEDDDVPAEAPMRGLNKADPDFHLVWAEDGEQALAALRGLDTERLVLRPRMTLLDLYHRAIHLP
jgi:DNA-binding response OmpR family regulator